MHASSHTQATDLIVCLVLLPATAFAQGGQMSPGEATCRQHLQAIGNAVGMYLVTHEGRLPAKASDLYTEGLVPDLGVFTCPASGNRMTSRTRLTPTRTTRSPAS